jgi:hypothetical protein
MYKLTVGLQHCAFGYYSFTEGVEVATLVFCDS